MVEEDHHHQQHKLNGVAEPENATREDDDDVAAAQRRSMGVAAKAVHHHNIEPLTILPAVLPSSSCSSSSTTSVPQFTPPANPALKPTTARSRAKVPLEKGYSQMVWLKLLRTEPDLAGLKGKSNKRLIPIAEVKQHCTEEDAWTVLRGCVYNISPYIRFHPGGRDMLMKGAGKDCTSLFSILITLLKLFFFSGISLLCCESDSRHLNNHPCLLAEQCSYILFPVSIYCK